MIQLSIEKKYYLKMNIQRNSMNGYVTNERNIETCDNNVLAETTQLSYPCGTAPTGFTSYPFVNNYMTWFMPITQLNPSHQHPAAAPPPPVPGQTLYPTPPPSAMDLAPISVDCILDSNGQKFLPNTVHIPHASSINHSNYPNDALISPYLFETGTEQTRANAISPGQIIDISSLSGNISGLLN